MSENDPHSIRTYIVTTNHFIFLGLQAALSHVTTTTMVHGNDHDAIRQDHPQLIILDMESHKNVAELVRKLKDTVPDANILLLGGLTDMKRTREAIALGVDGVVLIEQPPEVLLATVNTLIHSPPKPDSAAAHECSAPRPHTAGFASLSQRERDIVQLVGQGLTNKGIADRLSLSVITVRHHLTNIFDKLGVQSRQKLLIHVHQEGLVHPIE